MTPKIDEKAKPALKGRFNRGQREMSWYQFSLAVERAARDFWAKRNKPGHPAIRP